MTTPTDIIVVDDDTDLRELIGEFLTHNGFSVRTANGAQELDRMLEDRPTDIIVLDLMMPHEDGLSVIRRLRSKPCPPIIMLSAMGEDLDRIIGLEVGADDYLAKPCNPRELLARIRAVLRRGLQPGQAPGLRRIGPISIDLVQRQLQPAGTAPIVLSDQEFRILVALMDRPQQIVTRDQLIETTRGFESEVFDRAIDVTISRLRRKLANPGLIRTIRNEGYMLTEVPVP